MIRELFIAFVVLSLTVTVAAWFRGGPQLSVQKVQAKIWLGEEIPLPRVPLRSAVGHLRADVRKGGH